MESCVAPGTLPKRRGDGGSSQPCDQVAGEHRDEEACVEAAPCAQSTRSTSQRPSSRRIGRDECGQDDGEIVGQIQGTPGEPSVPEGTFQGEAAWGLGQGQATATDDFETDQANPDTEPLTWMGNVSETSPGLEPGPPTWTPSHGIYVVTLGDALEDFQWPPGVEQFAPTWPKHIVWDFAAIMEPSRFAELLEDCVDAAPVTSYRYLLVSVLATGCTQKATRKRGYTPRSDFADQLFSILACLPKCHWRILILAPRSSTLFTGGSWHRLCADKRDWHTWSCDARAFGGRTAAQLQLRSFGCWERPQKKKDDRACDR